MHPQPSTSDIRFVFCISLCVHHCSITILCCHLESLKVMNYNRRFPFRLRRLQVSPLLFVAVRFLYSDLEKNDRIVLASFQLHCLLTQLFTSDAVLHVLLICWMSLPFATPLAVAPYIKICWITHLQATTPSMNGTVRRKVNISLIPRGFALVWNSGLSGFILRVSSTLCLPSTSQRLSFEPYKHHFF